MNKQIITSAMVWNVDNVAEFRGFDVNNGEVDISSSEYSDYLDEIYDNVEVCGMSYSAGSALEALDPVAFRCGKGDYESELQAELEDALRNEDESEIKFSEHEVSDINEDDESEED